MDTKASLSANNLKDRYQLFSISIFHPVAQMINKILASLAIVGCHSAQAEFTCNDIRGVQSHRPLSTERGIVCFVKQPVLDKNNGNPVGIDEISLYFIQNGQKPRKAEGRGLLYDESPGEIVDAFTMHINQDNEDKIAIIQSIEIRNSLVEPNSSGKFYSVSIFDQSGSTLRRNERISEWFGEGYSWLTNGNKTYKYPYTTRNPVQESTKSPFAPLMNQEVSIPASMKHKSHLYNGPNAQDITNKYLINGDHVTVERKTGGWCQINYNGGKRPLNMWVTCDTLDP
ncbi:hypothetical protein [Ralstonia sp. ASV6]|uniref:hypothetical protein n=1 Tax=Ralstonia sp. ASV6 TaxID=2795124 RepID=UPI0018EB1014|nr:hypothetical protein [Ralstonia sp. ASV6]